MPDSIEWLAGIVEGEGCLQAFNVQHGKPKYTYMTPRLAVKMTDRDIVERVSTMFGTGVTDSGIPYEGCKRQWKTTISGKRAIEMMLTLFPYFGERRKEKVNQILSAWEHARA